jgi:hypothetical protein
MERLLRRPSTQSAPTSTRALPDEALETPTSGQRDLAEENRRLQQRVGELEAGRTPDLDDREKPAAMRIVTA